MDRCPVKTTGIRTMTDIASDRNCKELQQLAARKGAAYMRRRMSSMREGVNRENLGDVKE